MKPLGSGVSPEKQQVARETESALLGFGESPFFASVMGELLAEAAIGLAKVGPQTGDARPASEIARAWVDRVKGGGS